MFRPMRRCMQQVTEAECRRVLKEEKRAALSVIGDDGYPYTVPVNFYYDEEDNRIYIHGARTGHKIDALKNCDKVCFTVWDQGFKTEGNWEWNSTSVVVFGRAKFLEDRAVWEEKLRKLAGKYYPTSEEAEEEMKTPSIQVVQMIAIEIEHMTGKLVNEK
ncbi:MAG: pyridoxamine 5'-phosphate oxidase family protein [Lachnospiraceae bacterium]|nr:pyridoxamine 5'-phosphate oxidase family protein [Lachnospiraceae bacterium]